MKILTLRLGSLQTNCYILYNENSNECIVIDPADQAEYIAQKIQELELKCCAIISTHGHFDHNLAAGELQLILMNHKSWIMDHETNYKSHNTQKQQITPPYYINKYDLFLLKKMNESTKYFLRYNPHSIIPQNIKFIDSTMIHVSCFMIHVLATPGHTPGSICLLSNQYSAISNQTKYKEKELRTENRKPRTILFSGDTLFKKGIGRYDFSYSDKQQLINSLQKLIQLPPQTKIYPGHGDSTTIKDEIDYVKEIISHI